MGVLMWCVEHPTVLLGCLLAGLYTVWTSLSLGLMFKLRRVPGSRGPLPVLGLLSECIKKDFTFVLHELATTKYKGQPVFQAWVTTQHYVVVNDIDMARRLEFRYTARPDITDSLALRWGENRAVWNSGLLFIKGEQWRVARKAFEAAVMHPRALAAQAPFVSQVMSRSVTRLEQLADSGQPVDMLAAMYDCTIDAIGWAAFGIDLQATSRSPTSGVVPYEEGWWHKYPVGSTEFGYLMLQCAVGVMKSMDVKDLSSYHVVACLFPGWKHLVHMAARVLPDSALKVKTQWFNGLRESVKVLLAAWREQQAQDDKQGTRQDNMPAGDGTSHAENGPSHGSTALVSEQGFLARLLSGRDLAAGEKLEDYQIIGNAVMMVVTGYDTTAAAAGSMLYLLAQSPEAQRKAQEEVDRVLQGKPPQLDDLERLPYLTAAFTETLRLLPSAGGTIREVADDQLELAPGIVVPNGVHLYFPHYTYMRDPVIWPRADEFLPKRHIQPGNEHLAPSNPGAYIPFGHGARMCVGYKYAQMEARMALAHLLQRFTFETVPGLPPPEWRTSLSFGPRDVVLNIKHRKH